MRYLHSNFQTPVSLIINQFISISWVCAKSHRSTHGVISFKNTKSQNRVKFTFSAHEGIVQSETPQISLTSSCVGHNIKPTLIMSSSINSLEFAMDTLHFFMLPNPSVQKCKNCSVVNVWSLRRTNTNHRRQMTWLITSHQSTLMILEYHFPSTGPIIILRKMKKRSSSEFRQDNTEGSLKSRLRSKAPSEVDPSMDSNSLSLPPEFDDAFVGAVFQIGLQNVSPTQLLGPLSHHKLLTTGHIKSRLQRYRNNIPKAIECCLDIYHKNIQTSFAKFLENRDWEVSESIGDCIGKSVLQTVVNDTDAMKMHVETVAMVYNTPLKLHVIF